MRYEPTQDQLEDLRQRLELVYGRAFEMDETRELAGRVLELYEELKSLPPPS